MAMFKKSDRTRRTRIVLARLRGQPQEWGGLFAVLCLSSGWTGDEVQAFDDVIDVVAIAERLDEIRGAIRADVDKLLAELKAAS